MFLVFSRRGPKRHLVFFVQPFLQVTANEPFVPEVIGMRNLGHDAFGCDSIMAGCFRHHISHRQALIGHLKVQLKPVVSLLFRSTMPDISDSLKPFDTIHSRGMAQLQRQAIDQSVGMVLPAFGHIVNFKKNSDQALIIV